MFEVHRIDVFERHEAAQVDLLRQLRRDGLELVVRDHHEQVLLHFVAAHDIACLQRDVLFRTEEPPP